MVFAVELAGRADSCAPARFGIRRYTGGDLEICDRVVLRAHRQVFPGPGWLASAPWFCRQTQSVHSCSLLPLCLLQIKATHSAPPGSDFDSVLTSTSIAIGVATGWPRVFAACARPWVFGIAQPGRL